MNLVVKGFTPTKSEIERVANNVVAPIIEGYKSALAADLELKAIIEVATAAREKIKDAVFMEAGEYTKGDAVIFGVPFQLSVRGQSYDYDKDPEYARINAELKARQEILKKAILAKAPVLDEASGELIPVMPYKHTGTVSISYSIPK